MPADDLPIEAQNPVEDFPMESYNYVSGLPYEADPDANTYKNN